MLVTVVGAELPVPVVDEALLPPPTDVLGGVQGLQADLLADDYFIRWVDGCSVLSHQLVPTNSKPHIFHASMFIDVQLDSQKCHSRRAVRNDECW
jgi:hypothetical protein